MTLHLIARIGLILALAAGMTAPAAAELAPGTAVYLEGTTTELPWNTTGSLNFTDPEAFHFEYGDARYTIPADSITGYKWDRDVSGIGAQLGEGAGKIGSTVLPMFFDKTHYLTVYYRKSGAGTFQRAVFQVQKEIAKTAEPILDAWVKRTLANPIAASAGQEGSWWGNRYWKTKRNRHVWDGGNQERSAAEDSVEVATREE